MFNKLVNKLCADKIMHFLAGGWICSFITLIAILQEGTRLSNTQLLLSPTIGFICVLVIEVMKELSDTKFDWKDVLATMIGAATVYLATGIGVLFNVL